MRPGEQRHGHPDPVFDRHVHANRRFSLTAGRIAWAAAAVVAAALVLRTVALTNKALSFDETYSVFIASQPVARALALTAINEAHPPLYYVLLGGWVRLFGEGEGAVRALSVAIGAAVVLITYLFGRRLVGPTAALLGAGLVALAPSQVSIGQEARMYGLLTLTALGSWWALWAAANEGRGRAWAIYAVLVAAMIYVHYYAAFVMVSQAGYLLWRRSAVVTWRPWIFSMIGALVLASPWLAVLPTQLATGRPWPTFRPPLGPALYVDALSSLGAGQHFIDAIGGGSFPRAIAWPVAALLLLVAAAGYRAVEAHRGVRGLLISSVLLPLTVAFVVSYAAHVFAPRYLVFAMPGLALLAGAGIERLTLAPRPWLRAGAVVAVAGLLVANVVSLVEYYQAPKRDVIDWRRVALALQGDARPDDTVVLLPGFSRIPVNYYFRGPQPRLALTPSGPDAVGEGGLRMPGVIDRLLRHPRVWIVTVLPVPRSVETLTEALRQSSYAVRRVEAVNHARIILLERSPAP